MKIMYKIKQLLNRAIAWLNQWQKDLILHFSVADNINTVVWVIFTITLGFFVSIAWAHIVSAIITVGFILIKDYVLDDNADWRDIAAGVIGLAWSQIKVWSIYYCWLMICQ